MSDDQPNNDLKSGVVDRSTTPDDDIAKALDEKKSAIVHLMKLADIAESKGILQTLEYFLQESDELLGEAVEQVTSPTGLDWLSIMPKYLDALSKMDAAHLPRTAEVVSAAVRGGVDADSSIQVSGFWDIIRLTRDPQIRIALGAIFSALKSMGSELTDAR